MFVYTEDRKTKARSKQKKRAEKFMIASADEIGPTPAWRVALGNIAAGATAGATVEAGDYIQLRSSLRSAGLRFPVSMSRLPAFIAALLLDF